MRPLWPWRRRRAERRAEAARREERSAVRAEWETEDAHREAAAPWRTRDRMTEEASDLLDQRLDLTRDAAPWNVATFATLTAGSAAIGTTVALTGPAPWWLDVAPWTVAGTFLGMTALSLRQLGPRSPRPARRAPRPPPDPREMPLDPDSRADYRAERQAEDPGRQG